MKKLTKSNIQTVSRNLDKWFNLAEKEDIKGGKAWYKEANDFCVEVARKFKTDPFTVAQVLSALSPRNKWEKNKLDTITVLQAIKDKEKPENVSVSTFHKNKFKAFAIARKKVFITEESQKTFAFCQNIAHLNDEYITIDVWHLRACFGRTIEGACGKVVYKQIQRATLRKAKKLGLKGYEYQAILWNSVRRSFIN